MRSPENVVQIRDLNNQPSALARKQAHYDSAINETLHVQQKQKKNSCVIAVGFILYTHGLIFEFTANGWVLRPNNYLHHTEVIKRYPKRIQRARFYKMRHAQKQWLNSL